MTREERVWEEKREGEPDRSEEEGMLSGLTDMTENMPYIHVFIPLFWFRFVNFSSA
jgi:hypothetical protein